MSKDKDIRQEKKKGLSDAELIAKHEAGKQPMSEMIGKLLSKPAPNAPVKINKRPSL